MGQLGFFDAEQRLAALSAKCGMRLLHGRPSHERLAPARWSPLRRSGFNAEVIFITASLSFCGFDAPSLVAEKRLHQRTREIIWKVSFSLMLGSSKVASLSAQLTAFTSAIAARMSAPVAGQK
jgi:hypothetical protein